jgi:hypothetical protein
MSRPSLTESLLHRYFTSVSLLRDYLAEVLVSAGNEDANEGQLFSVTQVDDPRAYVDLINTTYVAFNQSEGTKPRSRFKVYPADMYMNQVGIPVRPCTRRLSEWLDQVIDKAQELLLRRVKGKCHNVITFGYRIVSARFCSILLRMLNRHVWE